MLVINYLSCLPAGSCESHTENNIVKSGLEKGHKVFTGHSLHHISLVVIVTERLLKYAVDEFSLLLLAELKSVLTYLSSGAVRLSV